MITRDIGKFSDFARNAPADFGPATAKAAFLIAPEGFSLAEQSASDNLYMDLRVSVDPQAERERAHLAGQQRARSDARR